MSPTLREIPILALWEPLHPDDWGPAEARHFLERAGFATTPDLLEQATDLGAEGCAEFFFAEPRPLVLPPWIEEKFEERAAIRKKIRKTKEREEKRELRRENGRIGREAIAELEHEWLRRAADPRSGFRAKWELFLSDVWVVGRRSVREAEWLAEYRQALAEKCDLPYPRFSKDFSRNPAMVRYLDLNRNSKKSPNENFARELFELFLLGEGNYTETDIKEAARAFTGRKIGPAGYRENRNQIDDGVKTVFGRTGRWDGDGVIDIAFLQPAARTFLPSELIRFYLTVDPIPQEQAKLLGDLWAEEEFRLDALRRRVFSSRAFYARDFRQNRIKSPIEFYIGTLQRFGLSPVPVPNFSSRLLRSMGQDLFEPPNVRGWIGGEAWINAGKLGARRQMVNLLFDSLPERRLNADDKMRMERERERGAEHFVMSGERLAQRSGRHPREVILFIEENLLVSPLDPPFRETILDFLGPEPDTDRVCEAVLTVLQSPQYQLC